MLKKIAALTIAAAFGTAAFAQGAAPATPATPATPAVAAKPPAAIESEDNQFHVAGGGGPA